MWLNIVKMIVKITGNRVQVQQTVWRYYIPYTKDDGMCLSKQLFHFEHYIMQKDNRDENIWIDQAIACKPKTPGARKKIIITSNMSFFSNGLVFGSLGHEFLPLLVQVSDVKPN